jgi:hypothetical protein
MTIQQFLLILLARWWIVLLTLVVVVAGTATVSLMLPKTFTASTAVVLDVKSPDPVGGMVLPGLMTAGYMATQVDIINSDRVSQRVVKMLKLDESPVIRAQWQEATQGRGQVDVWLADLLQKKLEVKPAKESNVISIGFSGADPRFVAAVANAFARAYIDVNLELKVEPARQYASWFTGQVKSSRERLEVAQAALSAYQQKAGLVVSDERLDYENNKINELSSQLTAIQTQNADGVSKRKSTANADTLAEVMQNPLVNNLKSDISRLEARLQDNNVNLGKNHPQTQRAESELASLKERLEAEVKQITSSIGTTVSVGKQKEKELIESLAAQKAKVLELNKQRDELMVLRRDLDTAQRDFDVVSVRSGQTRLDSQSNQTNIAILNPAFEPLEPSKPRVFLNILVSVFLGTMLGVGLALLLELVNRRVRSADDLAETLGLPLLAAIPRADKPGRLSGMFGGRRPRAA